jgi:hypothetical protein
MPRPGVIRPRAPLVRDGVRIELAAQDGEIEDVQVVRMAKFILSFLTETERVSLSSRGKIEGYDPPVERFRKAAEAFITKFELDDMLAVYDEREEEPPPEPGEDLHDQADDSAGSQRASSTSDEDIAEQRLEQLTAEEDPSAGPQQANESDGEETEGAQGQEELPESAHPEGLARKTKVSPSFQALRSPSTHRYTTRERVPDSPDSPIDWGGVDNERDSSDEDSQAKPDSAREKGKGKEELRSLTAEATYALEKQELARERKIWADHRATASEREVQAISASVLISALQTRSGCPLFTTPTTENKPILPSRSPSTCNSSPLAGPDRRFSVDELGSPSFNPRFTLEPRGPDWGYTSQLQDEPSE